MQTAPQLAWQGAKFVAEKVNDVLRHSNLYRCAEYEVMKGRGYGAAVHWRMATNPIDLYDFNMHDLDVECTAEIRKRRLSHANLYRGKEIASMLEKCAGIKSNHPAVIRFVGLCSDTYVGPRKNAQEARAYIRRSALKLHPDKCRDLEGWNPFNAEYRAKKLPGWNYEHAKEGAATLFALHRALDKVWANPYCVSKMRSPTAKHGQTVHPVKFAAEYAILSAAITVYVPWNTAFYLGLGAAAACFMYWRLYGNSVMFWWRNPQVKSREVVKYCPTVAAVHWRQWCLDSEQLWKKSTSETRPNKRTSWIPGRAV